jgi:hypothetical protein
MSGIIGHAASVETCCCHRDPKATTNLLSKMFAASQAASRLDTPAHYALNFKHSHNTENNLSATQTRCRNSSSSSMV